VEILRDVSDETRIVVSEPLSDLSGAWIEVPESHYGIVQEGQDVLAPLVPRLP
jgi:glutamine amidotransferase